VAQLRVDAKSNEHKAALRLLYVLPIRGKSSLAMRCLRIAMSTEVFPRVLHYGARPTFGAARSPVCGEFLPIRSDDRNDFAEEHGAQLVETIRSFSANLTVKTIAAIE